MNNNEDNNMKILIAFFSATGNTKKIAKVVNKKIGELNISTTLLDITSSNSRKDNILINDYDAVIFGFPIYSMRAPRVCREWLEKIDGEGKKCSVFFTYGGFGKDPAHYYMKQLLEKQNFELVSTAEFLGAHTFNYSGWEAAEGRPNESDYEVAKEYVMKTINKIIDKDYNNVCQFNKPMFEEEQLDQFEKYRFMLIKMLPTRESNSCSMCGICEKLCPTNAMDALKGSADPNRCIACFRCIANCPDNILHTNDVSHFWNKKLETHKITKEQIDNLQSRIFI
jgi:flavodoxin/Fe-S-cluster-containing hydrogenase component 2